MAVPFRRTGKTTKRIRRGAIKAEYKNTIACSNCGEAVQMHHVCPNCGYYKGKKVLDIKKD